MLSMVFVYLCAVPVTAGEQLAPPGYDPPSKERKSHSLKGYHELYGILYDSVDMYLDKDWKDNSTLKSAILLLAHKNYKAAAEVLIPNHRENWGRIQTTPTVSMRFHGGNNPVYWAALRLAYQGTQHPFHYKSAINQRTRYPPALPTDPVILEFAKHIIPAWEPEGFINRFNKIPKFAKLFNYTKPAKVKDE